MAVPAKLNMVEPPLWVGGTAAYPYSSALADRFTRKTNFGDEFRLFHVQHGLIHLPRAICPPAPHANDDRRVLGSKVALKCNIVPRPGQQAQVFRDTLAFLRAGQSGLVRAYTGFGKTVLGLYCAAKLGVKTLVITTKEDLFEMWRGEAKKFLGLADCEIGTIRQDKCDVAGKKLVIAMIHSLSLEDRYPEWISRNFGLVIFDECHRVPADQFSVVAGMFPAKLRLGLTATEERADGKEVMLYAHIGPIRVATEVEEMVPRVFRFTTAWKCPLVPRRDPVTGESRMIKLPHAPGKVGHVLKRLIQDEARNQLLAELIETAFRKGRRSVFFSESLDHLARMMALAVELGLPKSEMGKYVGGMKQNLRDRAKVKPILFATYTMMADGTNIPWLDLGILGTPRSKVTQPVGRIRREYENKPTPILFDVLDYDSAVFAGYGTKRLRWYKSIGAGVSDM